MHTDSRTSLRSIWMSTSGSLGTTLNLITHSCSASSSRIVRPFSFLSFCIYSYCLVDIPPSQVNILDGNAEDLVAECQAYEQRIKDHGGVELFLGGIGEDGHIAFNASRLLYLFGFRPTNA